MLKFLRGRFWVATVAALLSATMFILTLVARDWIERIIHVAPDGGDGSLEWALVLASFLLTVALSLTARHEWLRASRLRTV